MSAADATGTVRRYDLNVSSCTVFAQRDDGRWNQVPWHELPEFVRAIVWKRQT